MKLFHQKRDGTIPADLAEYTDRQNNWQTWVRRVVVLLIIVSIVAATIWAGARVLQRVTNDEPVKKPLDQSVPKDTKGTTSSQPAGTKQATPQTQPSQDAQQPRGGQEQAPLPKTGDDTTQPPVLPATGG